LWRRFYCCCDPPYGLPVSISFSAGFFIGNENTKGVDVITGNGISNNLGYFSDVTFRYDSETLKLNNSLIELMTKYFANLSVYTGLLMLYLHVRGVEKLHIVFGFTGAEIGNILNIVLATFINGFLLLLIIHGKNNIRVNYLLVFVLLFFTILIIEISALLYS
jgi:hypothetical protein